MNDLDNRLTKVETEVENMKEDVAANTEKLQGTATKKDVEDLKRYFGERDSDFTKNMWKLIFGLLVLLGGLLVTMFGIENLPGLFS
ncbi:hypothetical protein [Natroniella sp. ANB-PHB2]|uniref:hypothetical protein n=1 Tax=Natroniella sp. ANB-PHB2 TaxID=3384444 RepID=UPI0038D3808F